MTIQPRLLLFSLALVAISSLGANAQDSEIPPPLRPWQQWATWGVKHQDCPAVYSSASDRICIWASRLELDADDSGATWNTAVETFEEAWVPLPGSTKAWPIDVRVNDEPVVVVQRGGVPAVQLPAGKAKVTGKFRWNRMPQTVAIPNSIGVIALTVNDQSVNVPNWNASGLLWLRRVRLNQADKDQIGVNVYRVIEDGIPVWLRTQIELTVSGKSREEELGWVVPSGWNISKVDSRIPVAIDDAGQMKAQVRAGKWIISVDAFHADNPSVIQFADDAQPIANRELIGIRTDPTFRIAQLEDIPTIDVSQTTFPKEWRGLPVHHWDTATPFRLVEKMRGVGDRSLEGLTMQRRLWLDEDGQAFTYQDRFRGQMQQIWRLDVNDEHELGAVRIDGEAQLITANPTTDAAGVEIRRRNLDLEAIGRTNRDRDLSAIGWQADADSLNLTLTLPPGWRALAVFGADQVSGDWLTAWSLLDLFLLLIFALAVRRLFGNVAGILALIAFALSYHELGAPRFTWLFLLLPLALSRVVGAGSVARWINAWKYAAMGLFLLCFIPFIARQTQDVIYPQLEPAGYTYGSRGVFGSPSDSFSIRPRIASAARSKFGRAATTDQAAPRKTPASKSTFDASNLLQNPQSKIQTGPAQPQWDWNNVHCTWNGPVSRDQTIRPILLSQSQTRLLTATRLILLMLVAGIVLRGSKLRIPLLNRKTAATATALALLMIPTSASAQIPDAEMLETLRQRLLETDDVFPRAAQIPTVDLVLAGNRIEMTAEVHAALEVAVPLPGKLPAWSPVSVKLDGQDSAVVTRRDGYLWALVPKGVHKLSVTGLLPNASDWEWTYLLKPNYLSIDADGWKVSGIDPNGVPGTQVFFVRERDLPADQAAYDRTDFKPIVSIARHLEIGLVSKVRTVVTRLSPEGKAVSLQVPLLAGESVLSGQIKVEDNLVPVHMNATQKTKTWESELPYGASIELVADPAGQWVERWHLVTSPIWNVTLSGLAPVFETQQHDLIPVWKPWPGEQVKIDFSEPNAISGDVMTVQNVRHEISLGDRRRVHQLTLDLDCSLAGDFVIEIDRDAEIVSLKRDGQSIPVQRDGKKLIVPAKPGKQTIAVEWRTNVVLSTVAVAGDVKLPVESSNMTRVMVMPENRWVLWAAGPLRGPAVRFWAILMVAILAAIALGCIKNSPLGRLEWVLLVIGLTQVHLMAAMTVVFWLFLLAWRGRDETWSASRWVFNLLQIMIVCFTFASLMTLVFVVGEGLLGNPEMFIVGNGSSQSYLQWFQPRIGQQLSVTRVISISVWFYRFLMLCWALWLATALMRWLIWGWKQFNAGGAWKKAHKPEPVLTATVVDRS